ncbi:MAG TPA: pilus assembly protein PilM [Polyangiaceae bacterium]|jgi:general secretion pathway protein L
MARLVGIDIRHAEVRAVLLQSSYRHLAVEEMREISVSDAGSLEQALHAGVTPLLAHADSVAVSVDGESAFIHRLVLPATALKELNEILPFEIEAQVPVDIEELVYDHRTLHRQSSSDPVIVLAAAARVQTVKQRIGLIQGALGREPDRVGCGALPLVNLCAVCPELEGVGPIALIDLGDRRTEVAVLEGGEVAFGRTLSRGIEGLPASAAALGAELKQTFTGWMALGSVTPIQRAYLVGGGATAQGAEQYLSSELGIAVTRLPRLELHASLPGQADPDPRFAKAIALALGLSGRARDLDVRKGPLAFQRGFAFLKERVPLLAGLGAAILISLLFSVWAELHALGKEREVLQSALEKVSESVLGEGTKDADQAMLLIDRAKHEEEPDPMPQVDGFDVMVELSKAVPTNVTHDVEELDLQRNHVRITGIVGSAAEAQVVAGNLKEHRCFEDPKVAKVSQVVNSDRQKYVLEFDIRCADGKPKKKQAKKETTDEAASQ